ncbi:hypothetical protein HAX54_021494 [Datura stramonium]|uniref:Uncharacterized protein n=1 Tax=Datura stramonium TaxID=4076 RepID=A0ABS8UVA3_DATST|nr:hypothetical protein [Datura stramonium]
MQDSKDNHGFGMISSDLNEIDIPIILLRTIDLTTRVGPSMLPPEVKTDLATRTGQPEKLAAVAIYVVAREGGANISAAETNLAACATPPRACDTRMAQVRREIPRSDLDFIF